MRKIPVIICIDVEPDEREIESTTVKNWEGFEGVLKFLGGLRGRLEKATEAPVSFSWFMRMDPQIEHTYGLPWWVAKRYREAIAQLERAGDEIGLHVHAWRWDNDSNRWIIDHGDQKWIDHCLRMSFAAYQTAFGRPCLSFRFGDHWMNNETMDSLENLGIKFDLTIEPGMKAKPALVPKELHTGSLPDYTEAPRQPYRPSRTDFRKQSGAQERGLWMIPLSTARGGFSCFPSVKHAASALGIDLQKLGETTQLNLGLKGSRFSRYMNSLLDRGGESYLAPVVRTDVGIDPVPRAHMEQNMEFILSHPLVKCFKFVRPAEAIELLTPPAREKLSA